MACFHPTPSLPYSIPVTYITFAGLGLVKVWLFLPIMAKLYSFVVDVPHGATTSTSSSSTFFEPGLVEVVAAATTTPSLPYSIPLTYILFSWIKACESMVFLTIMAKLYPFVVDAPHGATTCATIYDKDFKLVDCLWWVLHCVSL